MRCVPPCYALILRIFVHVYNMCRTIKVYIHPFPTCPHSVIQSLLLHIPENFTILLILLVEPGFLDAFCAPLAHIYLYNNHHVL